MRSKTTPKVTPVKTMAKRPTGQFQGLRETEGKINGGGYGEAQHPTSHAEFERLGSKL